MGRSGFGTFFSWRTLLTGLASAAVDGLYWNWTTGLVLTLLLYLHEAGHVLAARWRRVEVIGPPTFVPGFCAYVVHARPHGTWDTVWIALGGPAVGGLAALTVKLTGMLFGSADLTFAGHLALWINLFNLAPVRQLDGSHTLEGAGPLRFVAIMGLIGMAIVIGADPVWPVAGFVAGLLDLSQNDRRHPSLPLTHDLQRLGLHLTVSGALALSLALSGDAPPSPKGAAHEWVLLIYLLIPALVWLGRYLQRCRIAGHWLSESPQGQPLVSRLLRFASDHPGWGWLAWLTVRLMGLRGTLNHAAALGGRLRGRPCHRPLMPGCRTV